MLHDAEFQHGVPASVPWPSGLRVFLGMNRLTRPAAVLWGQSACWATRPWCRSPGRSGRGRAAGSPVLRGLAVERDHRSDYLADLETSQRWPARKKLYNAATMCSTAGATSTLSADGAPLRGELGRPDWTSTYAEVIGWAASRRKPARPARKIPRPIRWAAGAGFRWAARAGRRFRRTGGLRRVTPWRSRHCRKAEFCDVFCEVPEPDDDNDELAPQPVTAKTAVSTTAPSTPGLAARPGTLWDKRVNNVSLTDCGPATSRRPGETGCLALCSQWAGSCDFVAAA